MLAKVSSCAIIGLDGQIVEVEVDISQGVPRFDIVGLGDTAVQEAKEPFGRRFATPATASRTSGSP